MWFRELVSLGFGPLQTQVWRELVNEDLADPKGHLALIKLIESPSQKQKSCLGKKLRGELTGTVGREEQSEYTHTHTHEHTNTYIHTYIYMYTYMKFSQSKLNF